MPGAVDSSKIDEDFDWFLSYGKTDGKSEEDPVSQCLRYLEKDPNFEAHQRYQ